LPKFEERIEEELLKKYEVSIEWPLEETPKGSKALPRPLPPFFSSGSSFSENGLQAHELRPSYLQIKELDASTYDVLWKVPAKGDDMRLALDPIFDGGVSVIGEPVEAFVEGRHIRRWQIKVQTESQQTP
jgi:hypothetical protein